MHHASHAVTTLALRNEATHTAARPLMGRSLILHWPHWPTGHIGAGGRDLILHRQPVMYQITLTAFQSTCLWPALLWHTGSI